jgi:cytochrome c oxidase assembly protein subunit 11
MNERRRHFLRLTAVAAVMFTFGFVVMPPLYYALCELTGFNGRTSNMVLPSSVTENPQDRTVTVELLTTVNGARGYTFSTATPRLEVQPGRLYTVEFVAQNTRDHAVVAQAVPSVAPWNAARHLRKTECFCFQQQPFAAGEQKRMPMRFMLDPELPADVDTVTLSYTFFDAPQVASR